MPPTGLVPIGVMGSLVVPSTPRIEQDRAPGSSQEGGAGGGGLLVRCGAQQRGRRAPQLPVHWLSCQGCDARQHAPRLSASHQHTRVNFCLNFTKVVPLTLTRHLELMTCTLR
jgi:hypothetical protein